MIFKIAEIQWITACDEFKCLYPFQILQDFAEIQEYLINICWMNFNGIQLH